MENLESDVIENVLTRRHILNKEMELIKNRISGRDNSFLPFICNKEGIISHRKLTQTINELIDGLKNYEDHYNIQSYCNTPIDREIYSCFFFCAMLGIAEFDEDEKYVVRSAEYFSDITDIAAHENNLFLALNQHLLHTCEVNMYFDDVAEGFSRECTEYSGGGFFKYCDAAYLILKGEHIVYTIDERDELFDIYFQNEAEFHGFSTYKEYQEFNEMIEETGYHTFDSEEYDDDDNSYEMFDEGEVIARQYKINNEWKNNHPFPEEYVKKYLRFRELFFQRYGLFRKYFFDIVQTMVDIFLYVHGLSFYSDEDAFALADSKLDGLISGFAKRGSGSDR